jgi:hypothetical protein
MATKKKATTKTATKSRKPAAKKETEFKKGPDFPALDVLPARRRAAPTSLDKPGEIKTDTPAAPPPVVVKRRTFMDEQKDADAAVGRAEALDAGLKSAKDDVSLLAKAVAHALATPDDNQKLVIVSEIADVAARLRDRVRRVARAVAACG